jgi:SAM-dependent methyltransferase
MNIKKVIICILMLGSFGICMLPAYAETIPEQVNRIKPYIESRKAAGLPVCLVIGASNGEDDAKKRFEDNYILLDLGHPNNDDHSLTSDINDLGMVRTLFSCISATFGGPVFDMIILDGCVYHCMDWSRAHITEFRNALKPGGQFMFKPYEMFGRGFSRNLDRGILQRGKPTDMEKRTPFKDLCKDMLNEADKTIQEDAPEGKLYPRFTYSSVYPSTLWDDLTAANVREKLRAIDISLDDLGYDIASLYDWDAATDGTGCNCFSVIELVIIVIFHKKYVPYYEKVLKEVFGQGNVTTTIRKRVELPFKAHWDFSSSILFTATKG